MVLESLVKIYLHLKELDLLVKLQDPKVIIKNNEINLTKFDLFLSIKSFYSSDFLLKKANIGFEKNDIKDITKITLSKIAQFDVSDNDISNAVKSAERKIN